MVAPEGAEQRFMDSWAWYQKKASGGYFFTAALNSARAIQRSRTRTECRTR
jgi:hypothetical protein